MTRRCHADACQKRNGYLYQLSVEGKDQYWRDDLYCRAHDAVSSWSASWRVRRFCYRLSESARPLALAALVCAAVDRSIRPGSIAYA